MEKYKEEKENIFSPKISLESPQKRIKSTIFTNNINNISSLNQNILRRSLTPFKGNFLLNQIGYIKNDSKYESKKTIFELNKKAQRKQSSPDINKFVNKLLLNHNQKSNFDSYNKNLENPENVKIEEKNSTEFNHKRARRKSEIFRKIRNSRGLKLNNKCESTKNIQDKSSLSFGEVDEENNEDYDDNNSSYISKIESKHVSMYDIDEDLKELKEIGNDLKSPVCAPNKRNYNNRFISSFSINNNDNENENDNENNNDYLDKKSILSHLKKKAFNNNQNIINHNPIVFNDNSELSFHEDQHNKNESSNIQNVKIQNLIAYNNDKYIIKKIEINRDIKFSVSWIEAIKNKKYGFYYKNNNCKIKKMNIDLFFDINQIEIIRKKRNNININDYDADNSANNESRRNSNNDKSYDINIKEKNNIKNICKENNKYNKKDQIPINNAEISEINNYINNNIIGKDISLKNNYYMNNKNELNKLIKEKINFLSMKNYQNFPQMQNLNTSTNKSKNENKINMTFVNTSLNGYKDISFNNNDLFMTRENNIFCSAEEDQNKNNITYNKYYNGNNITMNNFYNNYKLNDSNHNTFYNTEINNNGNDNLLFNKSNNIIYAIKNKLALKLKEEINKNKDNSKIKKVKDSNNADEYYYKCSSQDNLNPKKRSIRKNHKVISNGLNNNYRDRSYNNLPKNSSVIMNQKNIEISNHFDNSQETYSGSDEFLKNIYNESISLNPINRRKFIYDSKKKILASISKSNDKINKNKKKISFEKQILNKSTKIKHTKQIVKNANNKINNTKLNNPINNINLNDKKINNNNHDIKISLNKDVPNINNYYHKENKRKTYNKNNSNYNNNNNEAVNNNKSYSNLHKKKLHNNSKAKSKKSNNLNKSIENKSKNSSIYNKCLPGEIISNKIGSNYDSNKNRVTKDKYPEFRHNRLRNEKNPIIINKKLVTKRMDLNFNDINSKIKPKESSNNTKIKNKNNIKNKITANRSEARKIIINKGNK